MKFSEVLGLHFGRKFQKIWIFSTQSALHTDYKKLTVATASLSHGIADSIEGNSEPEVYRNNFHLSSSKTTQKFDLSKFWASFWKEIKEISGNLDIYI